MKNVVLGIDEFTMVILPNDKYGIEQWERKAKEIIDDVFRLALFEPVFDGRKSRITEKLPAGYTSGYNVGVKDFYFAVAYNVNMQSMGICVRFSAKAWAIYQARYEILFGEPILLSQLLHMISDNIEEAVRLSKIDFTADYFDYGMDMDKLYSDLKSEKTVIQGADGWSRIKTIQCFEKNGHAETIYIGSRKENSRGFLRIYDKRIEQIQTHGFRLKEALDCDEWIRFEAVFRGHYAHQITEKILKGDMDAERFTQFIAFCITSKYRLCDSRSGQFLECTEQLLGLTKSADFGSLRTENPWDNSLSQNIQHIKNGSGFYSTLYKVERLYGVEAVDDFVRYLLTQYEQKQWLSNTLCRELELWLKKHEGLRLLPLEDNY